MNALERLGLAAVAQLAPHGSRDALIGDLLEERALLAAQGATSQSADAWLLRQCACSLLPLAWQRARRAGPARVALAAAGALAASAALHAAQQSGWRLVLSQVPLRADHAPSPLLTAMFACSQIVAALSVALLLLRLTRPGGRA